VTAAAILAFYGWGWSIAARSTGAPQLGLSVIFSCSASFILRPAPFDILGAFAAYNRLGSFGVNRLVALLLAPLGAWV